MKLTIIPSDSCVIIDGFSKKIDCSTFDILNGVHAVQWDEDAGHVEYVNSFNESFDEFKKNESIGDISPYKEIIDLWNETE